MRCRPFMWIALGLVSLAFLLCSSEKPGSPVSGGRNELAYRARSVTTAPGASAPTLHGRNRVGNTPQTVEDLLGSPTAILLENALFDTARPLDAEIPPSLRSQGDAGACIVQCKGPTDESFRLGLTKAGASIVSYIPNNAYLVRASAEVRRSLAAAPQTQAILPYEPYYKLKTALLEMVLAQEKQTEGARARGLAADTVSTQTSADVAVKLLLFDDLREQTLLSVHGLDVRLLGEETSPFGPVLTARCPVRVVPQLAALTGVQEIELLRRRAPANDLTRAALASAVDSTTKSNYLGLTGTNVVVNVNDSGVDSSHPDLAGRVILVEPAAGIDVSGHGTHVAGIIAGSGYQSLTVPNAPGSVMPPAARQFRGLAPGAKIFTQMFEPDALLPASEALLAARAAETNALISNNSWNYAGDNDYDLAAATFDAAVRDALPGTSGAQPLLCVFPAGNSGSGSDNGRNGLPGTIQSPGTAKNVITVGALEHPRFITNQTWTCTNTTDCRTNTPWLGLTDTADQVAGFSSRGNVGAGIEGAFGRFKPDVVAPGVFALSPRSAQWDQAAAYSPTNANLFGVPDANYFQVLSNLNNSAGVFYRFDSGTSLAAAAVSGALALMHEFFQRVGLTNSPALMKALLINGARPVGAYDIATRGWTNFEGWGVVQLPYSIPSSVAYQAPTNCSLFFLDQSPDRALATGQKHTEFVSVRASARTLPLRVTLAWTDPPANPVAGVKLVNDLDLIVTNLDTGAVFFGNCIAAGDRFNSPWDTASAPAVDRVNNVENVLLAPSLSGLYSVTVVAARVNVNAVTASAGVVQDYALAISCGDGQIPAALSLDEPAAGLASPPPQVIALTNQFCAGAADFGCILPLQRISAGAPGRATNSIVLPGSAAAQINIGEAGQWRFYSITNSPASTNAVFLTFLSTPLAEDAAGLLNTNTTAGRRAEADIDLYVSQDSGLTNLDPGALAAADKSLGRGGAETLVYSNAVPAVYYIGVKCESAGGAQYALMADFSDAPFAEVDGSGNIVLRGFPAPAAIPGHAGTSVLCVAPEPVFVRRVLVTNTVSHPEMADLAAVLATDGTSAVLLNHSTTAPAGSIIFDDSAEADIPGARPSDGPGTLEDLAGPRAPGQWRLDVTSTNAAGTNDNLWVSLEPQADTSSSFMSIVQPSACRRDLLSVPLNATNLSVAFTLVVGAGPVAVQLYPIGLSPDIAPTVVVSPAASSGFITVDNTSVPPLAAGVYAVRICNSGSDAAAVRVLPSLTLDSRPPAALDFTSEAPIPITDDAVSTSTITVTNADQVAAINVGVRIDHPRVSDLVLHLLSPAGSRVLLQEDRGGLSVEGEGTQVVLTNATTVPYNGGPEAFTTNLDTGQRSGTISVDYEFYSLPDRMTIYYENTLLLDTGFVSGAGHTNLSYGPGTSTFVTIVMNENGNPESLTAWWFQAASTRIAPLYLTFTEDTNFSTVPIKYAVPPLTNVNHLALGPNSASGIFYLPEESLDKLVGEPAAGSWTLEIEDTRTGGTNGPCTLVSWQLEMVPRSARPLPVPLYPGVAFTNSLGQGQIQWFAVDVPAWAAFATNQLLFASQPVNLLFNPSVPPTGTNALDSSLLVHSSKGVAILKTNGAPALVPGSRYFLAIQNTNNSGVTFALQVSFDVGSVVTLPNNFAYATNVAGFGVDYYRVAVSPNAVRAQFEIISPTADLTLLARKGLPLPSLDRFDYASANPWTNDELIVVFNFSTPVPLSAGDWYLGVVNTTDQPAAYSVMATEFPVSGTNLFTSESGITNQSFCLTWTSLTNVHYFVQGKTSLTDTNWITASPEITATDSSTTFCIPLPCPFEFFRVCEGLVLTSPPPAISISRSPNVNLRP